MSILNGKTNRRELILLILGYGAISILYPSYFLTVQAHGTSGRAETCFWIVTGFIVFVEFISGFALLRNRRSSSPVLTFLLICFLFCPLYPADLFPLTLDPGWLRFLGSCLMFSVLLGLQALNHWCIPWRKLKKAK